VAVNKNILY